MQKNNLEFNDIASVVAHVHQGAIDVLGSVVKPATVHQSKFSMGTVLAVIARHQHAGLAEFDAALQDAAIADFRDRVTMLFDPEIDAAYPKQWIGKVTVHTRQGQILTGRVDVPKGDPGNTLTRLEIEEKALRLGCYHNAATREEVQSMMSKVWGLTDCDRVGSFL